VKISVAAYQGRWIELKADEGAIGKCKWSAFGFGTMTDAKKLQIGSGHYWSCLNQAWWW
jgi:hypothetical protein